jgi:putative phage-type endonuclease
MNPLELVQLSEEWFAYKAGKVSASHIAEVMAKGQGITRNKYMVRLILERISGLPTETYQSSSMAWGTATEPLARSAYEFYRDVEVKQIGFCDHPSIEFAGSSPDGWVGDDGGIEIKCPDSSTHLETLLGKNIDSGYIKQIQFNMACSGREWFDFISFDPRFPERYKLFVKRVERDDVMIKDIEEAVVLFNTELLAKIEELEKL